METNPIYSLGLHQGGGGQESWSQKRWFVMVEAASGRCFPSGSEDAGGNHALAQAVAES